MGGPIFFIRLLVMRHYSLDGTHPWCLRTLLFTVWSVWVGTSLLHIRHAVVKLRSDFIVARYDFVARYCEPPDICFSFIEVHQVYFGQWLPGLSRKPQRRQTLIEVHQVYFGPWLPGLSRKPQGRQTLIEVHQVYFL